MQQMNLGVHDYGDPVDIETWAALIDHAQSMRAVVHLNDRLRMTANEVARFKRRYPKYRVTADLAVKRLCWPGVGTLAQEIYRAHVREILVRIQEEKPVQPATDAEILVTLMNQSARPNQTAAALFSRLLSEVSGAAVVDVSEPWVGATEQLHTELRNQVTGIPRSTPITTGYGTGEHVIRA